ncbi:MAG: DegT/DnrJ/EryC1/StrS family aminotransferase [bacterium]
MRVRALDLTRQYESIRGEVDEAINRVLSSGKYILGEEVENFEKEFANYNCSNYAIGVGSGTDALLIGLMALGIGYGDEVITPSYSFTASADVILRVGAEPVFCDVCNDFNIDPSAFEKAITKKTKAIIVVHLFGLPCDMEKIMNIAKAHNLFVIEDCAQAIGAEYKGKKVGAIGDIGCFSFFPTKNLSCYGDGGAIITNDSDLYEVMKTIRVHGQRVKYVPERLGIKSRLDTLQASVLSVKLRNIDNWNEKRRGIARKYIEKLSKVVETPIEYTERKSVYHQFTILTDRRDGLREFLKMNEIETGIYYPRPINKTPLFDGKRTIPNGCSVSDILSKMALSLPMYPELRKDEIEEVIEKIMIFYT